MAAITWRNIDAPSVQGVSSMITGAQQSLDSGFNKFNELIKQRETMDNANWDNTKQNNTQAFLDQLTQYRTPEELKAAQESGVLDRMRQEAGAQIDRAGIRGAEDVRYGALQQRGLTNIDYANKTLAERYRPQTDAAMAGAVLGKADAVNAILGANPDMPGQDRIQAALVAAQRAASGEQRQVNADVRAGEDQISKIASAKALQGYYEATTRKTNAEAGKTELENSPGHVSGKKAEEAKKEWLKQSLLSGGTLDTADGSKLFYSTLRDQFKLSENEIEDIRNNLGSKFEGGKYSYKDASGKLQSMPVPVQTMLDKVRENPDLLIGGSLWTRLGDASTNALQKDFQNNEEFKRELAQAIGIRDGKNAEVLSKSGSAGTSTQTTVPNPFPNTASVADKPVLPPPQDKNAPLFVNTNRFPAQATSAPVSPEVLRKQLKEARAQQYLNQVMAQGR